MAHDLPLDEDALSRAPAWLRWIVKRKRANWERSVYLLTGIDAGAGADGSDALIGVNITRLLHVNENESHDGGAGPKPSDADGLTTSSSSSSSSSDDDDDDNEVDGDGEVQESEQQEGEGEEQRGRRRRRRVVSIPSSTSSSSSSESVGPDGPIESPSRRAYHTSQERDDDDEGEEQEEVVVEEEEEEEDADLECPLVRTYIGGPVKPKKRVLIHLSHQSAISANAIEVPLDREREEETNDLLNGGGSGEGSGGGGDFGQRGTRAYVYVQQNQDTDDYMEEIIGEAMADALASNNEEEDEEGKVSGGGGLGVTPKVHIFLGHARWSRTQLMNEIARGDWGLCPVTPQDLTTGWRDTGKNLWKSLYDSGRPVFAKPEDE